MAYVENVLKQNFMLVYIIGKLNEDLVFVSVLQLFVKTCK